MYWHNEVGANFYVSSLYCRQFLNYSTCVFHRFLAVTRVCDSHLIYFQNGRACLGDLVYRYITSDQFSAECLLDCLDLSSEHVALEIANRVESSIYVWRRRAHSRPPPNPNRSTTKSSWEMVKDLMVDGDKRELLAERAESLLLSLKHRFPNLTQTALDTSKIQFNKVFVLSPAPLFTFNRPIALPFFYFLNSSYQLDSFSTFRMLGNQFSRAIQEFWRAWHLIL